MLKCNFKFLHLWRPVPPVLAISYFSPRYGNDSIILQYAHRVLAGHPVDLTFFFVPQVVQALRHDALGIYSPRTIGPDSLHLIGYVERFIFETAKLSQLFCHQIIWNMKANCYKGDAGEIVSVPSALGTIPNENAGGYAEAHVRSDDRNGGRVFIRRSTQVLRSRIRFLQRSHIHIWEAKAFHQEAQTREEGMSISHRRLSDAWLR